MKFSKSFMAKRRKNKFTRIRKRYFKVELEVSDRAFEGEHLYTSKEIKKIIKNRLPFTLFIKKLKVKINEKE